MARQKRTERGSSHRLDDHLSTSFLGAPLWGKLAKKKTTIVQNSQFTIQVAGYLSINLPNLTLIINHQMESQDQANLAPPRQDHKDCH
jgi:hypothetical protein